MEGIIINIITIKQVDINTLFIMADSQFIEEDSQSAMECINYFTKDNHLIEDILVRDNLTKDIMAGQLKYKIINLIFI